MWSDRVMTGLKRAVEDNGGRRETKGADEEEDGSGEEKETNMWRS